MLYKFLKTKKHILMKLQTRLIHKLPSIINLCKGDNKILATGEYALFANLVNIINAWHAG